jgi:hypothetical protein
MVEYGDIIHGACREVFRIGKRYSRIGVYVLFKKVFSGGFIIFCKKVVSTAGDYQYQNNKNDLFHLHLLYIILSTKKNRQDGRFMDLKENISLTSTISNGTFVRPCAVVIQ